MGQYDIKAVVFDLGNVLITVPDLAMCRHICSYYNGKYKPEEVLNFFHSHIFPKMQKGSVSTSEAELILGKRFGFPDEGFISLDEGIVNMFNYPLFTNPPEKIEQNYLLGIALRARGYRTPIFTDTCIPHMVAIKNHGLLKGFNPIITSCMIGYVKTDEEAPGVAADVLNLDLENILLIDDRRDNILNFRRHGANGIIYNPNLDILNELIQYGVELKNPNLTS